MTRRYEIEVGEQLVAIEVEKNGDFTVRGLDCGGETTLRVVGEQFSFDDYDPDDELIAQEMGFPPSLCWQIMSDDPTEPLTDALAKAVSGEQLPLAEALLRLGANPNAIPSVEEQPVFSLAFDEQNLALVRLLIAHGASLPYLDSGAFGRPEFFYASSSRFKDWVMGVLQIYLEQEELDGVALSEGLANIATRYEEEHYRGPTGAAKYYDDLLMSALRVLRQQLTSHQVEQLIKGALGELRGIHGSTDGPRFIILRHARERS